MTACKFRGPYYVVGDVDWECETHGVLLELRDDVTEYRSARDLYCPVQPAPRDEEAA